MAVAGEVLGLEARAELRDGGRVEPGAVRARFPSIARFLARPVAPRFAERNGELVGLAREADVRPAREPDVRARPADDGRDAVREGRVQALRLVEGASAVRCRNGAVSFISRLENRSPSALNTPAATGSTTCSTWSTRARSTACTPPLPRTRRG